RHQHQHHEVRELPQEQGDGRDPFRLGKLVRPVLLQPCCGLRSCQPVFRIGGENTLHIFRGECVGRRGGFADRIQKNRSPGKVRGCSCVRSRIGGFAPPPIPAPSYSTGNNRTIRELCHSWPGVQDGRP